MSMYSVRTPCVHMAYLLRTLAPGTEKPGAALRVSLGMSGLLSLMVYSILLPFKLLKTMAAELLHRYAHRLSNRT